MATSLKFSQSAKLKKVKFSQAMDVLKSDGRVICIYQDAQTEYTLDNDHQLYLGEILEGQWFIITEQEDTE